MSTTTISDIKGIIYVIQNINNNNCYVGQTLSHSYNEQYNCWDDFGINMRLLKHLQRVQQKVDYPLYNDIRKFGFDKFKIWIELTVNSDQIINLDKLESDTIKKYNCITPNGYNLSNNTTYLNDNKKKIIQHYNQVIVRSEEYIKRNNRKKHLTLSEKNKIEFFKNKTITSIRINPIKQGIEYKTIRVLIETEEDKDIFRIQFSNKDIKDAINKALEFSKEISNKLIINPKITDILNDNKEIYTYQEQLDKIKDLNIENITAKPYYHKKSDNYIYLLIVKTDEDKIRLMFGGKNTNINDTYKVVKDFLIRLNISDEKYSLDCPQ